MYFAAPAAEYVIGGRDPGVYINEGIQIAQRQSLVTTDRVAAAVPASVRDLFFRPTPDPTYYSLRFMGFHLRDPDTGTVTGQFPQGYPIWIAIAYGLDGLTGTRRVIAWWAILGVLAVYFAASASSGRFRRPRRPACCACTSYKPGTRATPIPKSSPRLWSSRRCSRTHTRTKTMIDSSGRSRRLCWVSPCSPDLPVVLGVGVAVAASLLAHVNGHRGARWISRHAAAWGIAAGAYYVTQLRPYIGTADRLRPVSRSRFTCCFLLAGAAASRAVMGEQEPTVAAAMRTLLPARADSDRLDRRALRAVFPRARRQAWRRTTRTPCVSSRTCISRGRVRACPGRLRAGGVAIVLAGARAHPGDHHAGDGLLLQDEDLARTLLARAPVSHRDPARRARSSHRPRSSRRSG